MLTINIHNIGTGTDNADNAANYTYTVMVNGREIASGEVTGHNRADGWRELVRMVARGSGEGSGECSVVDSSVS